MSWKCTGLNPVPGGYRNYLEFIARVLVKVQSEKPSRSELRDYIKMEFHILGKKTPGLYVHVLFMLKLVEDSRDNVVLTDLGRKFWQTRDKSLIFKALIENYAGFEEIITFLEKKRDASYQEIRKDLAENHGLKWNSGTQVIRRLSWLQATGKIKTSHQKGRYSLA